LCGKHDQASIEKFIANQEKSFADSQYHVLVFFDNKDNVVYPQLPDPGLYFPEERYLKHIKAIYRFNYRLKRAVLQYYHKNMWDGEKMESRYLYK
jgi:hypothetical protein